MAGRSRWSLTIILIAARGAAAWAAPAPHSIEELFREPIVRDIALSPDGKRIAIAGAFGDQQDIVAVIDADRLGEPSAVKKFSIGTPGKFSPIWVTWANDKRLLVGLSVTAKGRPDWMTGRQIEAIDPDGENPVELFSGATGPLADNSDLSRVVDLTRGDPDHIVMAAWNNGSFDLFQVNVYTGTAESLVRGRRNTVGWDLVGGRPALRYDSNRRGTEISIYACDDAICKHWMLVTRIRRQEKKVDWQYAGDAPGVGKIFVRGRPDGTDFDKIFIYDLPTKTAGEIIAQAPGFDMSSTLSINGDYAGAGYIADTLVYLLKDRKLQSHWNGVRSYFHEQANVNIVDVDRERTRMVLHVSGPQAPGDFYLYSVASKELKFVASERPWLEPDRLAAMQVTRSPMRDGTAITAYLTWPAGMRPIAAEPTSAAPLPLIVMPHGGPELRDYVDYYPIAQAFAAQGWLVLQPNFRGSSGYGHAFAEAGHRQWARRMQDDVTDAVDDLVKRGIADARRIAIYGASYGGYAALIGAVVTPDLYRGAVSVAGVSDLRGLLDYVRSEDGSNSESYRYWVSAIGDPRIDKAALDAASPLFQVAQLRTPILLMHGTSDRIVPVRQSVAMKKALEAAHKPVEYLAFPGERHGGWSTEGEIKQITRAVEFLKPLLH